jgi:hypothetical protein
MTQHASLTPERWRTFPEDQRLMMIANEMNRVSSSLRGGYVDSVRLGYERVLRLTDLTAQCTDRSSLRRELLRWRGLVSEVYLGEADLARHQPLFRALLLLWPAGCAQLRALRAASPDAP